MGQGTWRVWVYCYTYRRAYVDKSGNYHPQRTKWEETCKYYRPWELLKMSEQSRKLSRPASAGASAMMRAEARRHQQNRKRAHDLEADYLRSTHRQKHWRRRQKARSRSET
ncbi:MAG: hypothetical protein ABEL51_14045 [Salinibacter sp.]